MSEEITAMTEAAEQTPLQGQMEGAEASGDPAGLAAEAGNAEQVLGLKPGEIKEASDLQRQGKMQPEQKPLQTPELNRTFAQRRREQELFRKLVGDMINPATGRSFENPQEFAQWKAEVQKQKEAAQVGLSPKQYAALEAQITQKVKESDPEVLEMRAMTEQLKKEQWTQVFQKDLAEIRAAYPDETAASIDELGEEYLTIMQAGRVSALAAYEAVRAHKQRQGQPPSMGDVGGSVGKEKEFFTRSEVLKMDPAQVSRNFEKIRRSQAKW